MMQALTEYSEGDFDFNRISLENRQELLENMYVSSNDIFNGKKQSKSDIQERIEIINNVLMQLK